MHVLIATDAWLPQINGVVETLRRTARECEALGHRVTLLTPEGMPSVPLPTYPDIRLGLPNGWHVAARIEEMQPDAIHIATEGPIGHVVRRYCVTRRLPFTTSFHTRFPDYVVKRVPIPDGPVWAWLRWFHNGGRATMVATPSLAAELDERGFNRTKPWPRGVDTALFRPEATVPAELVTDLPADLPRPIFLNVGRIAVEKNVEAFLSLDLPGTKLVVGDGPAREELQARFPGAVFLGRRTGTDLAGLFAMADVFVFPSLTDTYGLVLLEALASGVPVAALPGKATLDVIGDAPVAVIDADLKAACLAALRLDRAACRTFAATRTWEASARAFLSNLVPMEPGSLRRDPAMVAAPADRAAA